MLELGIIPALLKQTSVLLECFNVASSYVPLFIFDLPCLYDELFDLLEGHFWYVPEFFDRFNEVLVTCQLVDLVLKLVCAIKLLSSI